MQKSLLVNFSLLIIIYFLLNTCSTPTHSGSSDTLNDGLIAYYTFNKSVKDTSSSSINGINNNCSFVKGIIGKGVSFNGINSWVEIPHDTIFNAQAKSIQFWFYKSNDFINDTPNTWDVEGLIYKCFDTNGYRDFSFHISNQQPPFNVSFQTIMPDGSFAALQLSEIQPYQWYHIVGTINNSEISLYINGDLVNLQELAIDVIYTDAPIVIGKASLNSYPTRFFNGIIDELRIYNRLLTIEEINQLYALR